ncbi:MAG: YgaP-like transmembrane domain [Candidatus Acidiferrales bacterium]
MALACNLGRTDRGLRVVLGIGMGIVGILMNGHPYLGRLLGIAGAAVILSGAWGT